MRLSASLSFIRSLSRSSAASLCMSMSFVTFAISVDLVAQQSVFFRHQVRVLFKHLFLGGAKRPVFGVVDVHDGGSSNSV
ncbi:hypothetical protein ALP85_04623 [Pseudomonas syringae pv. syringae]|nr:hypothetical protein ALP85_04623 [Pseudomonas syringae pv. syringae]